MSKVITLKASDFDKNFKLKKNKSKPGVVVFAATWCGYCQQLKPELKKLAASKSDVSVLALDVDAPGAQKVFEHFKIEGFPAIRYVSKSGSVASQNFFGDRTAASIHKFIKGKSMSGGAKKKPVRKRKPAKKKPVKKSKKKVVRKRKPAKKVVRKRK